MNRKVKSKNGISIIMLAFVSLALVFSGCGNSSDGETLRMESTLTVTGVGDTTTDETLTISDTTVVRETGTPETIIYTFTSEAGVGVVDLTNGGLYEPFGGMISSADIVLNGEVVFSVNDFNQNVTFLQKSITLLSGDNRVFVTLQSQPDAKVTIRILQ
jgi:hypothetical protein